MSTRVSPSELHDAGVRLRPAEAVSIVLELCSQVRDGRLRGVPSLHVIRLTKQGDVIAEGPVSAGGAAVAGAADLLNGLLAGFEAPPEFRASGGLRIAIARALGTLDCASFESLDAFCAAIQRFAAPDVRAVARDLFASWEGAMSARTTAAVFEKDAAAEMTISDVRRARRATGVTIAELSERSRIPAFLIRELEWGYLRNWPAGLYGRSQLVRYARAAGLEEALVVDAALPLVEEAAALRGGEVLEMVPAEKPLDELVVTAPAAVDPADVSLSPVTIVEEPVAAAELVPEPAAPRQPTSVIHFEAVPPRRSHGLGRVAALAAAAALVAALIPAAWQYAERTPSNNPSAGAAAIASTSDAASVTPSRETQSPVIADTSEPRGVSVPDGAAPLPSARRVTTQPASYSPTFTNTGTAMFFREGSGQSGALIRADADTRGTILKITRIVDDKAQNFHARPSPDGTEIAFDSDREGLRAVYVADADGHHVRRVSGEGFAAVPSWSPDGRQLAFVKAEDDKPRVWNLWTVDLGTLELKRLTSYTFGQPWGGSWFPDGERIAYSHEDKLVVMNLRTGARRTYDSPVAGQLVRTPAVSPDGRRIIFQVYHDGAWLLNLSNGSMRRVLDDPSAEEYTWAPDGHKVAFHSHRRGGWGVWVMAE
jgi:TolB protein